MNWLITEKGREGMAGPTSLRQFSGGVLREVLAETLPLSASAGPLHRA